VYLFIFKDCDKIVFVRDTVAIAYKIRHYEGPKYYKELELAEIYRLLINANVVNLLGESVYIIRKITESLIKLK
jgi:hypothetical protein